MTGAEALGWFNQLKKVFNPRVLLMLVLDAGLFFLNFKVNNYSLLNGHEYAFTQIAYILFGVVILQSIIATGIVTYDQIMESKNSFKKSTENAG